MSMATSGGRVSTADLPLVAGRLVDAHFVLQHAKPAQLADVDIVGLDPFLRGLLFTDGTVSRALEAHTLSRVTVAPVEQVSARVAEPSAGYLDVEAGRECLRRRVTMRIADRHLAVWAESYIVPERLPSQFEATLGQTPQGIGGSLQRLKLESARELLCFGLAARPAWAEPDASARTLARVYRIVTQAQPALLITEHFALERRLGRHQLVGSAGVAGV
jgi:chorismate-pyruvate lyase